MLIHVHYMYKNIVQRYKILSDEKEMQLYL